MAPSGDSNDLVAELNKYKKDVLISIILHRKVPEGVIVSPQVKLVVDRLDMDTNNRASGGFDEIACSDRFNHDGIINMKNDLKIAELKIQHLQQLSTNMDSMIKDKDLIISLLQSNSKNKNNRKQVNMEYDVVKSNPSVSEIKKSLLAHTSRDEEASTANEFTAVGTSGASPDTDLNRPTQSEAHGAKGNSSQSKRKSNILWGENDDDHSSAEGDGGSFAAVARRLWLYVGRVQPLVTAVQIESYLKNKFKCQNFVVTQLPTHENALSRSFRVGADISLKNVLMDPKAWPKGVAIKPFRFFRDRSKKQQTK